MHGGYSGDIVCASGWYFDFIGNRLLSTFSFSPVYCRKGLVEVFDKVDRGELKEGSSSLSSLVTQMHKFRLYS